MSDDPKTTGISSAVDRAELDTAPRAGAASTGHVHAFYPPPALDPKATPTTSAPCFACGKPPLIYARIAGAIGDIQAVGKGGFNKEHSYHFRTIDDFYNALSPALAKHELVIQPNIVERIRTIEGKTSKGAAIIRLQVRYRYRIFTVDGSFLEVDVDSESLDYGGDKAPFKAASGGYKYLAMQLFAVRVADEKTDEPEDENVDGRPRGRRMGPPPSQWTGKRGPSPREAEERMRGDDRPLGVDEPAGVALEQLEEKLTAELAACEDLVAFQAWAARYHEAPDSLKAKLKEPGKVRKAAIIQKLADLDAKASADAAARAAEGAAIPVAPAAKPETTIEPCWIAAPSGGGLTCQRPFGHDGDHKSGDTTWPAAKKKGGKR